MKVQFYTKLVNTDSILASLGDLNLSEDQRTHLLGIVESSIHHAILDAILSELSEKDKYIFFQYMEDEDNEKLWKFLNERIEKIEDKITQTAESLKKELHQDIRETKGH